MQKLGKEGPTASADAPRAWEDMDCPDPSPRARPLRSLLDLIHLGVGAPLLIRALKRKPLSLAFTALYISWFHIIF